MVQEHSDPPALPDLFGPGVRLLLVGINPGLRSAAVGRHFAGHGNRFWPAVHAAGIVSDPICAAEQQRLLEVGVGITNLVARPSARASELTSAELRSGVARLEGLVADLRPAVVAVLGVTAYRVAFGRPRARVGRQPDHSPPAAWWVLPNPSGLNAHARLEDHAVALREVARAAGIVTDERPSVTNPRMGWAPKRE